MSLYNLKRVLFGCIRRPKNAPSSGIDKSVQWEEFDFVNDMSSSNLNHDIDYTEVTLNEQYDKDKCMAVGPAIPFHELAVWDALVQDKNQQQPPIKVFKRTKEVQRRLHLYDEKQLEPPVQPSNEIESTANYLHKTPKPRTKILKPAIPRKPSWLKKTRKESPLQLSTKSPNESAHSSKVFTSSHIVKPTSQSTGQLGGQNEFQFCRSNFHSVILKDDDR
ncbi:hypothetical protein M3Y98_00446400 [Aphelenchoides besseyi]|nr:hypothetical protein M3Y98_00446400 [Aphelenchoides besseyi]